MRARSGLYLAGLSVALVRTAALGQAPATPAAPTSAPTTQASEKPDMSPVVMPGSRILWDVPYVVGGHAQQKLDLYAPPDAKNAPVVVFIHGGEWTKGDKTEVSCKPRYFNQEGIIFVSANYRLSGVAHHPAQVEDVASAVRWVKDHSGEYGGDPAKIVLMGHSAGCHLVSLTGLDPRILARVGMKPTELAAVVPWSGGAYNLPEKVAEAGMYATYIRMNFGDDEGAWRDASPVAHIGDGPTPPFLFASAELGNQKSRALAEKMAKLINAAGGKAETLLLAGKSHTDANHTVGERHDVTGPALVAFIRKLPAAGMR